MISRGRWRKKKLLKEQYRALKRKNETRKRFLLLQKTQEYGVKNVIELTRQLNPVEVSKGRNKLPPRRGGHQLDSH